MTSKLKMPRVVSAAEGRRYDMGRMSASFIVDGEETDNHSSVSEWWLEPNTQGPPIHNNPEDHVFYVIAGELSVFIESEWHTAIAGSYVFIPGGVEHGFENRSAARSGFISINTPGGFESEMPGIVEWFVENPVGDAV